MQKETRDLSAALRGSYQETNPAVEYRGTWQPKPDAEASGGAMMVSTKAEDNATITFRGTSLSLLVAKSPNAGMFNVSVDGHEASQLPTDRQGRSYLDLFSDKPAWQVEVPIIEGLTPGEHTLRLVAVKSSGGSGINCGVDGFIVGGDPSASGNALYCAPGGGSDCGDRRLGQPVLDQTTGTQKTKAQRAGFLRAHL